MTRLAITSLIALLLGSPAALAQRGEATLQVKKAKATIDHGVPRYGSHSLEELPTGQTWRLGANNASRLITELPLISGRYLVAPGSYRLRLTRSSEQEFSLDVEGAGFSMHPGSVTVPLSTSYRETGKTAKLLEIEWNKVKAAGPLQSSKIVTRFGPHELSTEVDAVPLSTEKLKGYALSSFGLPAKFLLERNESGWLTAIAVLTRKGKAARGAPERFLLLIGKSRAGLVPVVSAPTGSFGFAEVEPPAAEWTFPGTVSWDEAQQEAEQLEFELTEINGEGEIHIRGSAGKLVFDALYPRPLKAR